MAIDRVKVALSGGGIVGPAAMNWYFSAATAANLAAINAFLTALKVYLAPVTYTIPGGGDTVNELDGKLLGAWSAGSGSSVVGTGTGNFAGQAGGIVQWKTGAVVDGHHPTGRAFLVPLVAGAFGTNGQMAASWVTAAGSAAATFLSSSSGFVIWHRPVYDRTVKPPVLKRPGSTVAVVAASVPTTSATLRSRNH